MHFFIASLAVTALILFCASVLMLANKYLPHQDVIVKSCMLRSIDRLNVKVVFLEVAFEKSAVKQQPVLFRFSGTNMKKIRETKKLQTLEEDFSPGSIVKMHYVPLFRWMGYFPETTFVRMEAFVLLFGAAVAISLTVFAASLAYGSP